MDGILFNTITKLKKSLDTNAEEKNEQKRSINFPKTTEMPN